MFVGPILGSLMTRWLDIRTVFFIAGSIHLVAAILFRALRIGADEHCVT